MKRGKGLKSCAYRMLMVAAALFMVILLPQAPAQGAGGGADPCASYSATQDRDNDGFTDYDECKGITYAGTAGGTLPGSSSSKTARANRLDPGTRDLFAVLVPAASGGYFGLLTNPLEYIYNTRLTGGLEIYVHQIAYTKVASDRTVCKTVTGSYPCAIPTGQTVRQKAVQVTESVDPGSGTTALILGSSPSMHGTPNDTDLATVYTVRIKNHLQTVCGCSGNMGQNWCTTCCDQTQTCGQNLFYKYVKHTIAHEIAHQIVLTTGYDAKLGWHYPEDSRVELDVQVHHDGNTFYVGTTFTAADQDGYRLK